MNWQVSPVKINGYVIENSWELLINGAPIGIVFHVNFGVDEHGKRGRNFAKTYIINRVGGGDVDLGKYNITLREVETSICEEMTISVKRKKS